MIRLQFSLQNCWQSNMIAWFSQGHFSHVDAVTPDGKLLGARSDTYKGRHNIVVPPGVQVRPKNYAKFSRRVIFNLTATHEQERRFYYFLNCQMGKPYDHQAIWGFAIGRDWREADSWICSELQAAALEYSGAVPRLYLAANKITPVALALAVSAVGASHVVY